MCYRSRKTDLAMEGPRLGFWQNRLKLLLMASLVYTFLLSLLTPALAPLSTLSSDLRPCRPRLSDGCESPVASRSATP